MLPLQDRGFSVEQAAEVIGVSRATIFELIGSGQLGSIKIGRRRVIPGVAIHEFITNRLADSRAAQDGHGTPAASQ